MTRDEADEFLNRITPELVGAFNRACLAVCPETVETLPSKFPHGKPLHADGWYRPNTHLDGTLALAHTLLVRQATQFGTHKGRQIREALARPEAGKRLYYLENWPFEVLVNHQGSPSLARVDERGGPVWMDKADLDSFHHRETTAT